MTKQLKNFHAGHVKAIRGVAPEGEEVEVKNKDDKPPLDQFEGSTVLVPWKPVLLSIAQWKNTSLLA
jgi:hypothetical protein